MGLLIDGKWHDQPVDTRKTGGEFKRPDTSFRNWITKDGSAEGGFKAEKGRYHLYVAYACPWAHRTILYRKLKKLEDVISMSTVHPHMADHGWEFKGEEHQDPLYQKEYLYEIYLKALADYTGRVTVPVLWDKKTETIVNNESAEIIRILNSEFNEFTKVKTDYCPENLRAEIDKMNEFIYPGINNCVYKLGFATSQEAYDKAYYALFATLEEVEKILSKQRYLLGGFITEADWRLLTTLLRFDAVYYVLFKCNKNRIVDYPNLWGYLRDLYQQPGVADTVKLGQIKQHYYYSQPGVNPSRVVPLGPEIDFTTPCERE